MAWLHAKAHQRSCPWPTFPPLRRGTRQGWFYVWTAQEIQDLLGEGQGARLGLGLPLHGQPFQRHDVCNLASSFMS